MNAEFDFQTAGRILFGKGKVNLVGKVCGKIGRHVLLVVGTSEQNAKQVEKIIGDAGIESTLFTVHGEPGIATAVNAAQVAVNSGCNVIIGCGGGSVIDTAKAAAALAQNPSDPYDYLEVVGKGLPLINNPLPLIAVPTTAGTGSEVTRNAVLHIPDHRVKVSLRDARMLPVVAIVDPLLTITVPPELTASTGMDALTQVIEPFVSVRANPFTDLFCKEGIQRGGRSLFRGYTNGQDIEAREDLAFCSLMGGLALANAGLGAVHGLAAPIGGMFAAPHGAICARLLPEVCKVNIRALQQREPENPALERYLEMAKWLVRDSQARWDDLVRWLEQLCINLGIPGLSKYGITTQDIIPLADKAVHASSFKANPIPLGKPELVEILEAALY